MCGIVGYIGNNEASKMLIAGLEKLEYRGYDSCGIALVNSSKNLEVTKSVGRINKLKEKINSTTNSFCGIGHTRWATHGKPTLLNAHPHTSNDCSVTIVHNGIIENYTELKEKLLKNGYSFYSETDTEVLANLIDYYKKKYIKPLDALARVCLRVVGSYAVCILFSDEPESIYCLRKDSPLVVAKSENGVMVASDVLSLSNNPKSVVYASNNEMIRVTKNGYTFFTLDQEIINKEEHKISSKELEYGKNGYPHFMLKEIYEQSKISKILLSKYTKNNQICENFIPKSYILRCKTIHIVACGSAYHAALVGAAEIEQVARVQTKTYLASEFRYQNPVLNKSDLAIFVSQSGETADTLMALRETKRLGIKTVAIVNVAGSSLSREADHTLYTHAGTEVAVATTKAYFAQVLLFHFFALFFAKINGKINKNKQKRCIIALKDLKNKVEKCLTLAPKMQHAAERHFFHQSVFFLGRGVDYAISQEASLKLKEISYIHSEAYASGELKHGTISLIDENSFVVGVITNKALGPKTISNLIEAKSRGANIIVFTSLGKKMFKKVASEIYCVPNCSALLQPLLAIIPLQLFAYYTALARGCDIDKPRNLAKSVTVE